MRTRGLALLSTFFTLEQEQEPSTSERLDWVQRMRERFSPPGMLGEGGRINQNFFKPEKARDWCSAPPRYGVTGGSELLNTRPTSLQIVVLDDKKWGQEERTLLYQVSTCWTQEPSSFDCMSSVSPAVCLL